MWNITWRKESKLWPDSPAVLSPPLKVVIPGKIWTKVKIPDESESEGESPIVKVKVKVKVTPESLWGWMKEKWISNLSKIGSCSHFLPHLFTVKNDQKWSQKLFLNYSEPQGKSPGQAQTPPPSPPSPPKNEFIKNHHHHHYDVINTWSSASRSWVLVWNLNMHNNQPAQPLLLLAFGIWYFSIKVFGWTTNLPSKDLPSVSEEWMKTSWR